MMMVEYDDDGGGGDFADDDSHTLWTIIQKNSIRLWLTIKQLQP